VCDVDGDVAHQADVALPAIGLEVLPLAGKLELLCSLL